MSRVSPTSLTRALVAAVVGEDVRLGVNDPDPRHLAPVVDPLGTTHPVYGQIYMIDGWRDRLEQHPEMEIAFYSRRFVEAERVASAVEEFLVRYPVRVTVGEKVVVLDRTEVTTATREVPWGVDAGVTRFIGSYQLRTRG